jgi:hypothetical protein
MVEYALIAILVGIVVILVLWWLGRSTANTYNAIVSSIDRPGGALTAPASTPSDGSSPTPTVSATGETPTPTLAPTSTEPEAPPPIVTSDDTAEPTETEAGTSTPTETPSLTPTPTLTPTPSPTPTHTATRTETATLSPTPTQTPDLNLVFDSDFESGDLSGWSSVTANVSADAAAAVDGNYGMQVTIDSNTARYATHDLDTPVTRQIVRFYFDPNSISMANNDSHVIYYGYSGTSTSVTRIDLRFSGGNYQIRAGIRNDAGSWTATSWTTISDSPHLVEADWRAASGAGAGDGSLDFEIDGAAAGALTGIDNDTHQINRARLGAVSGVDSGTRGAYQFDSFELRQGD